MTQCDLFALDIRDKAIWRLTPDEIDRLSEKEQMWVRNALYDMTTDGTLAILRANDPRTTYHVVWDRNHGWKMEPLCRCAQADDERYGFIEAYRDYRPEMFADGESQPAEKTK